MDMELSVDEILGFTTAAAPASTAAPVPTTAPAPTAAPAPLVNQEALLVKHEVEDEAPGDVVHNRCWGGLLSGDFTKCNDLLQTGTHFRKKHCAHCHSNGIVIPVARVRGLRSESHELFVNRPTEGFWTRCYSNLPGSRVINHTQYCTGPRLVIFEREPAAAEDAKYEWAPLAADMRKNGENVRLFVCNGTLVPRTPGFRPSSTKRERPEDPPIEASAECSTTNSPSASTPEPEVSTLPWSNGFLEPGRKMSQ